MARYAILFEGGGCATNCLGPPERAAAKTQIKIPYATNPPSLRHKLWVCISGNPFNPRLSTVRVLSNSCPGVSGRPGTVRRHRPAPSGTLITFCECPLQNISGRPSGTQTPTVRHRPASSGTLIRTLIRTLFRDN